MLHYVTFLRFFFVDWLNHDPVAEFGGLLHRGRISPVAAVSGWNAGIAGWGTATRIW
jgi:hypothetical protein